MPLSAPAWSVVLAGLPWPLCACLRIYSKRQSKICWTVLITSHIIYIFVALVLILVSEEKYCFKSGVSSPYLDGIIIQSSNDCTAGFYVFWHGYILHVRFLAVFDKRVDLWAEGACLRLHGITCCQMIWFFRQSGRDRSSKSMNALVGPCHIHF